MEPGERVLGCARLAEQPAGRVVAERVRDVVGVVVDGVDGRADAGAGGQMLAEDVEAAGEDGAREDGADWGGQAERFVDAGAEVDAAVEGRAGADGFDGGEVGADFGGEAG